MTPTAAISEVSLVNPKPTKTLADDDAVAFVGMADLDDTTAVAADVELRAYRDVAKGYTPFEYGDILLAKITPCFENMKIGQARTSTELAWGSTEFHVMRPKDGVLDNRYLLHFLRQPWVLELGELRMTGSAGQRRVPERFLDELEIPLPPIEEQRRIAAVLDAADRLQSKRRQAITKLETLSTSLVSENLAGYTEREPLGDHLVFVTSGSRGWAKYYSESGSRFIRSQDVLMGSIDDEDPAFVTPPDNSESTRTAIRTGDLLITITGIVGRVAAAPPELDNAFISQHVSIARPSSTLRPAFAEAFMNSHEGQIQLERVQYGQTKPGLNLTQIREFRLPVPRLAQQDVLLGKLNRLRCESQRQRRSEVELDTLFASLQQRAFQGEL